MFFGEWNPRTFAPSRLRGSPFLDLMGDQCGLSNVGTPAYALDETIYQSQCLAHERYGHGQNRRIRSGHPRLSLHRMPET